MEKNAKLGKRGTGNREEGKGNNEAGNGEKGGILVI